MAASDMRFLAVLAIAAFAPAISLAQSAGEVERCFQNPGACAQGGGGGGGAAAQAPAGGGGGHAATRPAAPAPAPDYTTVMQSPDLDRRKIQESLRTLDKYNGPIDGNLQSDATVKAIQDWQKGRNTNPVGKLTPPEAQQYEVSTWVSSDLTLRWQATDRVALEGQLKLTNPVMPFTPMVVGGAVGVRVRLRNIPPTGGFALEIGGRLVGISAQQEITRTSDVYSQTDEWNYRSLGIEVPLIATYRINPIFAVTASPFLRAYWIRAWHDVIVGLNTTQTVLQWSPVLSGGLGLAAAVDVGPVQLSPGAAVELATKPGPDHATHFLFEPGIAVGTRF